MLRKSDVCCWMLVFILAFSILSWAVERLLENSDFEIDAEGKPQGWSIMAAESGAISLDGDIAVNGQSSLKISHQRIGSYSSVSQIINVSPNSDYVISGSIKLDSVIMGEGAAGARIFIGDERGNYISSTSALSGTTGWLNMDVEFSSANRNRIQVILYLHKSSGTVWFDNLFLKELEKEKGEQLKLSGGLHSKVFYTPEVGFETHNYLRAYGKVNFGYADFYLYSCYEYSNIGFEKVEPRKFSPWINNLTVSFNGPLLSSLNTSKVTFGCPQINYSPYVAMLNSNYSITGQGIAIENINWNGTNLSGFLIWEPDNIRRYRFIGECLYAKRSVGLWKADVIISRYLSGNPEVDSNGKIISLGSYEVMESDSLLKIGYKFKNGVEFEALQATQKIFSGNQNIKKAKKIDFVLPVKKDKLKVSYLNFEPGFAPRYRDRTPRFSSETTLLSWNPVERYANQRGINVELSGTRREKQMHMEINHYYLQPECIKSHSSLIYSLKGKTSFNFVLSKDSLLTFPRYLEISLGHEFINNQVGILLGRVTYLQDQIGINNNLRFCGNMREYELEAVIKRVGIKIKTGIQHTNINQNYWYLQGEWVLLGNVQFAFAYRIPHVFVGNNEYWIDDYDRIHFRDNYFVLKTDIYF